MFEKLKRRGKVKVRVALIDRYPSLFAQLMIGGIVTRAELQDYGNFIHYQLIHPDFAEVTDYMIPEYFLEFNDCRLENDTVLENGDKHSKGDSIVTRFFFAQPNEVENAS